MENARSDALWIGPSGIPGGSAARLSLQVHGILWDSYSKPGLLGSALVVKEAETSGKT